MHCALSRPSEALGRSDPLISGSSQCLRSSQAFANRGAPQQVPQRMYEYVLCILVCECVHTGAYIHIRACDHHDGAVHLTTVKDCTYGPVASREPSTAASSPSQSLPARAGQQIALIRVCTQALSSYWLAYVSYTSASGSSEQEGADGPTPRSMSFAPRAIARRRRPVLGFGASRCLLASHLYKYKKCLKSSPPSSTLVTCPTSSCSLPHHDGLLPRCRDKGIRCLAPPLVERLCQSRFL